MTQPLSDRARWILGIVLITIASTVFAFGWTSPFWPAGYPILGSEFFKTSFFFISSAIFIVFFFVGLYLLTKTKPPPSKPVHASQSN
ncbi:MAG: hypothetical protein ACFE9D_01840 [Promethearchaeota archaeon]